MCKQSFLSALFTGFIIPAFCLQETLPFYKANADVTAVIVHDVFSPPVASRIYFYSAVAAYESVLRATGRSSYLSLCGQLDQLNALPMPASKVDPGIVGISAFYNTAIHYVFSEAILKDSFLNTLSAFDKIKRKEPALYQQSLNYGKQISDSIFEWSKTDNYAETRKLSRYRYLKTPGKWTPTPPAYIAAVEPYWSRIRTAVLQSPGACTLDAPLSYSTTAGSDFYREAKEVYDVANALSPEQKGIASFWDCNPFNVNTSGHLAFAVKKLSPGAHWMNITTLCCRKRKTDLLTATASYVLTAVAIYDGFIYCWKGKYTYNLIRPETYINTHIDAAWRPLLQTPPFPEYPSGHSVISTAAATVLSAFFGNDFSFDDDTEISYGLPVRHFTSFLSAANEAAISRLYGGIHFRAAIEKGQALGREAGNYVLQHVHLTEK